MISPFLSTATSPHPAEKAATPIWPSGQGLHSASATAYKAVSYHHANITQAHEERDNHKPFLYFSEICCGEQADQI